MQGLPLTLAQNFLKCSGRLALHSTVRLGSGAGPRLYRVLSMRKAVLVTMGLPASSWPARTQVTQVGSPANRSLYSGVRSCLQSGGSKSRFSKHGLFQNRTALTLAVQHSLLGDWQSMAVTDKRVRLVQVPLTMPASSAVVT